MVTQLAESRVDVLEKISENLGTIKKSMETMYDLFYYNEPIRTYLLQDIGEVDFNKAGYELEILDNQYYKALNSIDLQMDYVIAMENGFSYTQNGLSKEPLISKYKKKLWYRDIIRNKTNLTWISTYDQVITEKEKDYVFSVSSSIVRNGESQGIFLINVSERFLSNTYSKLVHDNTIYIIDGKGKIVSHTDESMIGFNFYNMAFFNEMFEDKDYNIIEKSGEEYLFSKHYVEALDWIIVEEISLESILTPLEYIKKMLILIIVVILFIGIIFALAISRKTSKPLKVLCNQLEGVGKGHKEIYFNVQGWDEINRISEECNSMVGRIDQLVVNVRETESKKRKAELDFLQMQINPHFMYNTLFSIKCLISMNKNQQAEKMLQSFITFLKSILDTPNDMITIEEEINVIKEYIYIQRYRFGDEFDVCYNLDKDACLYKVPRLLLQPIVENAIIHGIGPLDQHGQIRISVTKRDTWILITIEDNGAGMDNDLDVGQNKTTSIGLDNVKERLNLHYGNKASITIHSKKGVGTRVKIEIPLNESMEVKS